MRQKTELEITLHAGTTGEAPSADGEGSEGRAAKTGRESRAAVGPSMEAIVERVNLKKALARVKRNKGASGLDGMTIDELVPYLKEHWPRIRAQLLDGSYKPQPVRRVEIPKASGGKRPLGIPTVLDRFIQQAVMQVLQADWDRTFSAHSYGFRPQRSAHQAVARAQELIASGHDVVVDIDLEKFFDRVNHDILMGLVAKRVTDKRVLKLIRGFLTTGGLADGLVGSDGGGYAARRAALSAAVEPDARRAGQGIGDARPQLRAVCRRLQHLRAQSAGRRAGDGRRRRVPDQAPQAEGQQGEECGRPAEQAQVPGLQLHDWETAPAAHCAAVAGPVPKPSAGADASYPRQQPRADRQGAVRLSHRMARLLRLLRDPVGVA